MPIFGGSSSSKPRPESRQRQSRSKRKENPFRESEGAAASHGYAAASQDKENAPAEHRRSSRRQKPHSSEQARPKKAAFSLFSQSSESAQADALERSKGRNGLVLGNDAHKPPMPASHENHVKRKQSQSWMLNVFSSGKRPKSNRERAPEEAPARDTTSNTIGGGNLSAIPQGVDPGYSGVPSAFAAINGRILPFPAQLGLVGNLSPRSASGTYLPDGSYVAFSEEAHGPTKTWNSKAPTVFEAVGSRQADSTHTDVLDSMSYGESSTDSNYLPSPNEDIDKRELYAGSESSPDRGGYLHENVPEPWRPHKLSEPARGVSPKRGE